MKRCRACERRAVIGRLMIEAGVEWSKHPTGPSFNVILERLRDEAISRGEIDANPD